MSKKKFQEAEFRRAKLEEVRAKVCGNVSEANKLPERKKFQEAEFRTDKVRRTSKKLTYKKKRGNMKKILFLLLLCPVYSFATEIQTTQDTTDNKAVIALQKQPANETQKQKISKNIACIIIQINGKIKNENITDINKN